MARTTGRSVVPTLSKARLNRLKPTTEGRLFSSTAEWRPEPLPDLSQVNDLGFDTEGTGLDWWSEPGQRDELIGISVHYDGISRYVPFGHLPGGNHDPEKVREWARRELRGKRLFGSYLKHDLHHMNNFGVDLVAQGNTLTDVGHVMALLDDHRRKFDLETIAQEVLQRGKKKDHLDLSRLRYYHAGEVAPYAEEDAALPHDVAHALLPRIRAENLTAVLELEQRVLPVCVEMETNGAPINLEKAERWAKACEQEYLRLLYGIQRNTGIALKSVNSAAEVQRLFEKLGVPIRYYVVDEKTGRPNFESPSFSDDALAGYAALFYDEDSELHDPAIGQVISDFRRARKLESVNNKYLSKYVTTVRRDGGPQQVLRYSLNQLKADQGGAVTGRFSSSAFKLTQFQVGANVQQVPDPEKQEAEIGDDYIVRELFEPARGRRWCKADAKQIEYRIFAHYMDDDRIIQAYREDPDTNFHKMVHRWAESFRKDIPYKTVKNTNFCKIYGGGTGKIAATAGITYEDAKEFMAIYNNMLPGVERMLAEAERTADRRGYVKTLLGRRGRFPTKERMYKALNSVIQGGAADIMKQKLVELYDVREELNLTLRFTVHDEVDLDVPDAHTADMVQRILDRQSFDLKVPILWEVGIGDNWAEAA